MASLMQDLRAFLSGSHELGCRHQLGVQLQNFYTCGECIESRNVAAYMLYLFVWLEGYV